MFDKDRENITYFDKGLDKMMVNFVKIEANCLKCRKSFSLKSKFHKYIKADYLEKGLLLSSIQSSLFVLIVVSKIIYQALRLGLKFKS